MGGAVRALRPSVFRRPSHAHDVERPPGELGLNLGGDDRGARKQRRPRSIAIGLGNAHDVDAEHLLRGL